MARRLARLSRTRRVTETKSRKSFYSPVGGYGSRYPFDELLAVALHLLGLPVLNSVFHKAKLRQ